MIGPIRRRTRAVGIWYWVVREWFRGEPELRLLPALVDRPGAFADVGANAGTYSLTARRFADRVVAFEPHPDLAEDLRVVLGPRAVVRQLAASDTEGRRTFSVPVEAGADHHTRGSLLVPASRSGHLREFEVSTGRLDDEALDDLVVLKVDVEGHEARVLLGATDLLTRTRASVIVEAEERHCPGTLADVRTTMTGLGYTGWFLHGDALVPVERFSVDEHQSSEAAPGVHQQRSGVYVNNFVWLPAERPSLEAAVRAAARHGSARFLARAVAGRSGRR